MKGKIKSNKTRLESIEKCEKNIKDNNLFKGYETISKCLICEQPCSGWFCHDCDEEIYEKDDNNSGI